MKKMVIISLIIICIGSVVMGQSFDFIPLEKALGLVSQSYQLGREYKYVKAKRIQNEAAKILELIFKDGRIIDAEFERRQSDTHSFTFYGLKKYDPQVEFHFKVYYKEQIVLDSIKTSNDLLETLQDCTRFKAKIKIGKKLKGSDIKPYEISMLGIDVDCKILSITPNLTEEKSE